MIEFFEFLNTCSALRTIAYLVFLLVLVYMLLVGTGNILEMILYRNVKDIDNNEIRAEDTVED